MRKPVVAIPGRPLPHGILGGCATVEDVIDPHELLGVEWMALGCCPVQDWPDWCPDGDESPGEPPKKEFCRPETEHAAPHTIYAGAECSAMGWSYDEARQHALASLELGEQRALEAAFWRDTLALNAVDLTPAAGPVNVASGVAALEGCLAESYGGIGVLHVPAGLAAVLGCCNILREYGDGLRTLAGNCAIIGAGYSAQNSGPDGTPAEPGSAWVYVSGPVEIRRGPIDIIPDVRGPAINIRNNDLRVLAERTYVVGTTCTVCAIQVQVCP
jgi:hypothetical protein